MEEVVPTCLNYFKIYKATRQEIIDAIYYYYAPSERNIQCMLYCVHIYTGIVTVKNGKSKFNKDLLYERSENIPTQNVTLEKEAVTYCLKRTEGYNVDCRFSGNYERCVYFRRRSIFGSNATETVTPEPITTTTPLTTNPEKNNTIVEKMLNLVPTCQRVYRSYTINPNEVRAYLYREDISSERPFGNKRPGDCNLYCIFVRSGVISVVNRTATFNKDLLYQQSNETHPVSLEYENKAVDTCLGKLKSVEKADCDLAGKYIRCVYAERMSQLSDAVAAAAVTEMPTTTMEPTTEMTTTLTPTTEMTTTLEPTTETPTTTMEPTTETPTTTMEPTTETPTTTMEPTTEAPTTTMEPTTETPTTTMEPTTETPTTTMEPTTETPTTTMEPTTETPTTTMEPTTQMPITTIAPTTEIPTTTMESTTTMDTTMQPNVPTTVEPMTQASTLEPTTKIPTTIIPTTKMPITTKAPAVISQEKKCRLMFPKLTREEALKFITDRLKEKAKTVKTGIDNYFENLKLCWKLLPRRISIPTIRPPKLRIDLTVPKLPKPKLPKVNLPKINLPKPTIPKINLPKPKIPKVNLPKPKTPTLPIPKLPKISL